MDKDLVEKAIKQELFRRGDLSFLLHSSQLEVKEAIDALSPSVREAVVLISRRWGKSYLGVCSAIETCLKKPGAHVFIVAPSKTHAESIVVPLVKDITSHAPKGLIKHTKSAYKWTFSNGSKLTLGGFDTAVESFRGQRATEIYLEESGLAHEDSYEYVIKSVLFPTLLHSNGRIIHLTTPAPIIEHPLHTETIPKCEMSRSLFVKDIYSNPLITVDQIEELKKEMGGEASVNWQRECLCRIVRDTSTVVVPSFSTERHVSSILIPEHKKWVLSIDLGGVRDKSVALFGYWDCIQKKAMVTSELAWEPNTSTEIMVAALRLEMANRGIEENSLQIYADAPGQILVDLYQKHGVKAGLPQKAERDQAINNLNIGFYKDEIQIDPNCKFLISTLVNARFNAARTDFERTVALGHADALMALVYLYRMINKSNPVPTPYHDPQKIWYRPKADPLQAGMRDWGNSIKKRQPNEGKLL